MPKYDGTLYVAVPFEDAFGEDEDDLGRRALAALKSGSLDERLHSSEIQLEDLASSGPRPCDISIEGTVVLRYSTSTELEEEGAELLEGEGCLTNVLQAVGIDEESYDEADTVAMRVEVEWDDEFESIDETDPFWVKEPEVFQYHEAEARPDEHILVGAPTE